MLAPRKKYLGASWLLEFLPNFEPCYSYRPVLSASHTGTTHGPHTEKVAILSSASSFAGCASPCATRASSPLDQRYAFVVCVRSCTCGHALCVRRLRSSTHLAYRERTRIVLPMHVQRAQRSSSVFLACAWRAHSVWPWVI